MSPEKLLCKIAKILKKLEIPYFVTGGMAVSVWGKPRFTADIDMVIELPYEKIFQFRKKLYSIGKSVYVPEELILRKAIEKKSEFNFIHPQTGLKIDFWPKRYPFESFRRAIPKKIGKQKVNFISPEDLILSKLIWYKQSKSERHLEDIKSILEILEVNFGYIRKWAKRQSTIKILEKLI